MLSWKVGHSHAVLMKDCPYPARPCWWNQITLLLCVPPLKLTVRDAIVYSSTKTVCVCGCVCVLCVRLSWVSYNSMNISQNSQHWKWGLEYQTMLYLHKIQFLYFFYFFCCRQKTKDKKNLHQIYTQISFQIKKGTLHSPLENQVIHISHRVHKIRLEVTEWQNRLLLYRH